MWSFFFSSLLFSIPDQSPCSPHSPGPQAYSAIPISPSGMPPSPSCPSSMTAFNSYTAHPYMSPIPRGAATPSPYPISPCCTSDTYGTYSYPTFHSAASPFSPYTLGIPGNQSSAYPVNSLPAHQSEGFPANGGPPVHMFSPHNTGHSTCMWLDELNS